LEVFFGIFDVIILQQNSPNSQDQSLQSSKVHALCLLLSMELARSVNPDIVSYSSVISAAEKGAF